MVCLSCTGKKVHALSADASNRQPLIRQLGISTVDQATVPMPMLLHHIQSRQDQ